MKIQQPLPDDKGPKVASHHSDVNIAFIKALTNHTIPIACAAGLRQYQLERKYDPAYVINAAYFRACKAIDQGKEIEIFPGWIRLTCRHIIQELSREEQKSQKRNQQLLPDTLPAPQPTHWLDDPEATPEQLQMRAAFEQLSPLEQAILQFKIVKNMRWAEIQTALVAAGYPLMSPNTLSQKKRRALKHLEKCYRAVAR